MRTNRHSTPLRTQTFYFVCRYGVSQMLGEMKKVDKIDWDDKERSLCIVLLLILCLVSIWRMTSDSAISRDAVREELELK